MNQIFNALLCVLLFSGFMLFLSAGYALVGKVNWRKPREGPLGESGSVWAGMDGSPWTSLLVELAGSKRKSALSGGNRTERQGENSSKISPSL